VVGARLIDEQREPGAGLKVATIPPIATPSDDVI
jgi:hypothetical protein